jgi:carbamate kinase
LQAQFAPNQIATPARVTSVSAAVGERATQATALNKNTQVVAIGGNALVGTARTFEAQLEALSSVAADIAKLVIDGDRVVITHGNGPQVSDSLLRHQIAMSTVPLLPLYACVAETRGLIGLMIQYALSCHMPAEGIVSLVSITYVSKSDPVFVRPSKPVGPVYDRAEMNFVRKFGHNCVFEKTVANKYRRLVRRDDAGHAQRLRINSF